MAKNRRWGAGGLRDAMGDGPITKARGGGLEKFRVGAKKANPKRFVET